MRRLLAIAILVFLSTAALADKPRIMRHGHDASGHLIWHFTHDWQIVRSYRDSARHTYSVYHHNQLVERTSSLSVAKRVIRESQ